MSSAKLELLYVINISERWEGSYWLLNIIIFCVKCLAFMLPRKNAGSHQPMNVITSWLRAPYALLKLLVILFKKVLQNKLQLCYFCLQKGIYGGCFPFVMMVSLRLNYEVSLFDRFICCWIILRQPVCIC